MEKERKRSWKLHNSGYDEPIYKNYRDAIILQNSRMVKTTSFIGSIIMIILTLTALFVSSVSKVLPLYLITAILFTAIFFIARITGTKSGTVVLICNYAFLTAAFIFAIGLDIIQKNATATTVCVLLVALPLLIVDKPFREFSFFLIMSVCFMYESMYIKQSPKASIDVLNAFSFLFVGSFLGYKHNQMMLRNMVGHNMLERQRDIDTLTSLYNKGALEKRVCDILGKDGIEASIIVIDMDNFKFVNDTYGHHAGDELLAKIGEVLMSLFRPTDLISRFGGDEFVVFLPESADQELLKIRADQILRGVERIRLEADQDYRAHVCMGIATFPKDGGDYEELFRNADIAMYHVKKHGKNGYGFFAGNDKRKILVVDDIEMNRAILKKTLSQEYEMLEAKDGVVALQILETNKDIVATITDIQMPNMDGIELVKQIRKNAEFSEMAILVNTQYGDLRQEEELFKLGVDDFIYKAASPDVIQMRVKNVLRIRMEG